MNKGISLEGIKGIRSEEGEEIKAKGVWLGSSNQPGEEVKKDFLFARVAKHRNTMESQRFNFIMLKPDGRTLVVVRCVFVP